ncbi:metallophosphoesterase, DNA ligase-associated [Hartmannibacter diazotrophicus]|uniref:Metallophosphoesterase, DNA ligase-associated n=1 Tax=Hartmannibacter diazotrophicus TaxID=1482074 RepID=A0A2C9DDJ4_9HYPH|nr:ligase-associated DNA damage response endonuclease PdeM [Hartmannibacter diazotrophicus]SON58336.1 metallophosphoesterase, DNA ligase-associated [Hartmannibacter diazotrophicus]
MSGGLRCARLKFQGQQMLLDPAGALVWPDESLLVIADLHFEKSSSGAVRGLFLPPYDTGITLRLIEGLMERHRPRQVIALGDSFHDRRAAERLSGSDRLRIRALTAACDWTWVAGNHDPDAPTDLGGRAAEEIAIGPVVFRHEPRPGTGLDEALGEVAGHLHPAARVVVRGRSVRCRAFACDGRRLILPAIGAFTGGLNVLDPAFRALFPGRAFHAWMMGETRVHPVRAGDLRPG